jgi:hypothetical protein
VSVKEYNILADAQKQGIFAKGSVKCFATRKILEAS